MRWERTSRDFREESTPVGNRCHRCSGEESKGRNAQMMGRRGRELTGDRLVYAQPPEIPAFYNYPTIGPGPTRTKYHAHRTVEKIIQERKHYLG